MDRKELFVKHMVCNRCKKVVRDELEQIEGLRIESVELGLIKLQESINEKQVAEIATRLEKQGFELIDDKKTRLILAIKSLLIEEVHHQQAQMREGERIADFVARKMGYDYSYLNEIFVSKEGKTIGQFLIQQKIERVKELLVYDELSLQQIAMEVGYGSSQYLSAQFKKYTGLTPSHFRKIGYSRRKGLDEV